MPRTPENLPKHELIGLKAEVEEHTDQNLEGLEGTVVDETKNFLVIEGKKVEKKEATFVFELEESKVRVKGQIIAKRPEDRVKMRLPKKYESL